MTDPTGRPTASHDAPAGPGATGSQHAEHEARPGVEVPRPFAREVLESEEREIKDGILRMGSLVAERLVAAIVALESHDAAAATAIIEGDGEINDLEHTVSNQIALTIATQQPVARDLRFLLTLDHVAYDLERMGDYAASVAKQARKLAPYPPIGQYLYLPQMGRLGATMVRDVLEAVVDIDADRARAVAKRDDELDDLYHRNFAEVLELMRDDPANVDPGMRIVFAAHYLERVGDRVTNIAEDIVYLATGDIVELNDD